MIDPVFGLQAGSALAAILLYAVSVPLPGPSFVAITRASMVGGRMAGAGAAFGTTLAAAVYAAATLLGVSALLAVLPWLVTGIELCGGAYLVFLGFSLLRAHVRMPAPGSPPPPARLAGEPVPTRKAFVTGFVVTIGNPKVAAFFFGLFAPVAGQAESMDLRLLALAGIVLVDLAYHQTLAHVAAAAARSAPARFLQRRLDAVAGALMSVFGIAMLSRAVLHRP